MKAAPMQIEAFPDVQSWLGWVVGAVAAGLAAYARWQSIRLDTTKADRADVEQQRRELGAKAESAAVDTSLATLRGIIADLRAEIVMLRAEVGTLKGQNEALSVELRLALDTAAKVGRLESELAFERGEVKRFRDRAERAEVELAGLRARMEGRNA